MTIDPRQAAEFIDAVRKSQSGCRVGSVTRALEGGAGGWLTVRPGVACGEYASSPGNRVYWHAPDRPITAADVAGAISLMRETGCVDGVGGERAFIWIAPWACNGETERALAQAGATRVPYVEYVALALEAQQATVAPPSPFTVTKLAGADFDAALDRIAPWYSPEGTAGAKKLATEGVAEVYFVLDGGTPIGMGLLMVRGEWGYLGAADTDPAHRNRGAQKALIRQRVAVAAQRGAAWCICETNTAVPVSLTNLVKCGFTPIIAWRVYRWDDPRGGAAQSPPVTA